MSTELFSVECNEKSESDRDSEIESLIVSAESISTTLLD